MSSAVSGTRSGSSNVPAIEERFWKNPGDEADQKVKEAAKKIEELSDKCANFKANNKNLNQHNVKLEAELTQTKSKNEELQAEFEKLQKIVSALSTQKQPEVSAPAKAEDICQPTRATLQSMIDKVQPTISAAVKLKEGINALSKDTKKSVDWLVGVKANDKAQEIKDLLITADGKGYIPRFVELKNFYLKLAPEVYQFKADIEELIRKATQEDVPLAHVNTMSARNDLSIKKLAENDKCYLETLQKLENALEYTLMGDWNQVDESFESACADVKYIQKRYDQKGTTFLEKAARVAWDAAVSIIYTIQTIVAFERYSPSTAATPAEKPAEAAAAAVAAPAAT